MASIRRRINEIMADELTQRIARAVSDQETEGVDARLPDHVLESIRREILIFLAEIHSC